MPRIKSGSKKKTSGLQDRANARRAEENAEVANRQMRGVIKKQGTSKSSQTAADQQKLADDAEGNN